jgi:putative photosynthetic complex assembly protein 2
MRYLASYFKTSRVTPWFGVFALLVSVTAGGLLYQGLAMPPGSFAAVGYLLLAGLAWLAVFEHVALVMPIPDDALWYWAHPGKNEANNTDKDNLEYGRL